ncbi:MAG: tRNA lysidine(34) synthetase TilS [Holophagaceae bacterium]|nr:tRNA lysidine(34) synthetase TilS [Holophagaceae bacterium]
MKRFETDVLSQIRRRGDGIRNCSVIVACSGGGDSVALLACLVGLKSSLKLELAVAHANHNLRTESNEESEFVRHLCGNYGLAYLGCSLDVISHSKETNQGIETTARDLRWRWLKEEATKSGAKWIATGHTIEDHTETIFLRLARGSGAGCLTGLPAVQAPRWSPLIECRRKKLRDYLCSSGIEWREDHTNDIGFTPRNRWRKLMESFRTESHSLDKHLWETHRQIAELSELKDTTIAGWKSERWGISIEGGIWLALGMTARDLVWVLDFALKELDLPREAGHLLDLADWISKVASSPIKRVWKWGNWSLSPHNKGVLLQLGFPKNINKG